MKLNPVFKHLGKMPPTPPPPPDNCSFCFSLSLVDEFQWNSIASYSSSTWVLNILMSFPYSTVEVRCSSDYHLRTLDLWVQNQALPLRPFLRYTVRNFAPLYLFSTSCINVADDIQILLGVTLPSIPHPIQRGGDIIFCNNTLKCFMLQKLIWALA